MKKHPLVWFYVLAFCLSWLGWLPAVFASRGFSLFAHPAFQLLLVLPAVGPGLAAMIVASSLGKGGARLLLRPLLSWRSGAVWLVVAALGPALLLILGKALTMAIGSAAAWEQPGNVLATAVAALVISLLSNTWEEVGWRGFALPRLQARHSALVAALIVGALWGLWHLPLFFWKGNPMATYSFASWFLGTVALSFVYTWLYDGSKGSLFVVTIFHVLHNTFGVFMGGVSIHALTVVYCLAALLLVAVFGKENLARQERVRAATSGYGNSCCGQDSGRGSR